MGEWADSQKDGSLILLPRSQPRPHAVGQLVGGPHGAALLTTIGALGSVGVCVDANVAAIAQGGDGLVDVEARGNVCRQARVALVVRAE